MKTLISSMLAIAIMLVVPNMALAKKDKSGGDPKVTAVTDSTITVSQGKQGPETTYKTEGAKITVNGTAGKLSDITVGMTAKITVGSSPDVATAIDASAAPAKKKGKKKGSDTDTQ